MEEIRYAIDQQFTEPDFIRRLQEALAPALEAAVSRALEQRDAKIAALEEKLAATSDCLATTKERLKVVERELEHVGLESRKNCLLLNGVPELPDEDIDGLVLDVAKAAGITVHAGDLDRSHRLGSQRGTIDRPRAILVKLLSHKKRQQLYSVRKELSAHRVRDHPVLTPQVLQEVFMADFLTTKNQTLLYICRQLKRRNQLWAAYSTNGRIKVRMGEDQPARNITDISDLQSLLGVDNQDLREVAEACSSNSSGSVPPRSHGGQTAAEATRGGTEYTSRQTTSRAAGEPRPSSGSVTNKGRRQPPRHAGQTR